MQVVDWVQLGVFFLILVLLARPFGIYLCKVLDPKERTFLDPLFKRMETWSYRAAKVDPMQEQDWKEYLACVLGFSAISVLFVFVLEALQSYLPLNPQKFGAPSWHLNLNTSVSFMTNTDWQNYVGETTLSYFSQMAALGVQNFASAAVGLACAAALVRGLARKSSHTIGNFWADLIRINLYVLLPIAILISALFLSEGVPQNFHSYVTAETLDGGVQTIAQGPIASQESIKLLGTNGGGFMNANSAHPYENPTPLTNFVQMLLILLIPAAQIYYFGRSIGDTKHAWCIFAALAIVFIAGVLVCSHCEAAGNPEWKQLGLTGGNWEGKEQRFGIFGSAFYSIVTTASSCGASNCMLDSLTPVGGCIPMLNMQMNETIFGGAGAGLYSVLLFILLSIFISGLIVGRTPEYLGKKIESFDMKMIMFATIPFVFIVHLFTASAACSDWGVKALGNSGPHGFSEILYAYSSCASNNGSSFDGITGNTVPYNLTLAAAMLFGRFLVIVPVIALAGSLAEKKILQKTASSFPVSSFIFISLLVGIILLLCALTFLPALTMGPIIEQLFFLKEKLSP